MSGREREDSVNVEENEADVPQTSNLVAWSLPHGTFSLVSDSRYLVMLMHCS